MSIVVNGGSHIGKVRKTNEDSFCYCHLPKYPNYALAVVCDGVGGQSFGEVASRAAAQCFLSAVDRGELCEAVQSQNEDVILKQLTKKAHEKILSLQKPDAGYKGAKMATTLVAALVSENKVWWVNVGDSRLYALNSDGINQISTDQTISNYISKESIVQNGLNPKYLYYSLGTPEELRKVKAQSGQFSWSAQDKILLCSDGLTDRVLDKRIEVLLKKYSGSELIRALKTDALTQGGHDNITSIVMENV